MHIEPTFVRNRTNNLLNKAQAMAILKELEFIDPIDIVTLGGISDNPIDLVKRGLAYYAKQKNLVEKVGAENDSDKIYETDENVEYQGDVDDKRNRKSEDIQGREEVDGSS